MNDDDHVILTKKEYDRLVDESNWYNALIQAGVDNWGGYDDAWDIYEELSDNDN